MADYYFVKDNTGNVKGLWLRDPKQTQDQDLLLALLISHGLEVTLLMSGYHVEPNTVDDSGGCFVMFGSASVREVMSKTEQGSTSTAETSQMDNLKIIERLLVQHLSRTKQNFAAARGFQLMQNHWDKLLRPNILSFVVSAVSEEMHKSLTDNQHHYQTKEFGTIYVAVSTIPSVDPATARTYFFDGYSGFMGLLVRESGYFPGGVDLAHWVVCFDRTQHAVHLTFLPDMKLIQTQGPNTITVLAQDLMNEDEKAQAGLI